MFSDYCGVVWVGPMQASSHGWRGTEHKALWYAGVEGWVGGAGVSWPNMLRSVGQEVQYPAAGWGADAWSPSLVVNMEGISVDAELKLSKSILACVVLSRVQRRGDIILFVWLANWKGSSVTEEGRLLGGQDQPLKAPDNYRCVTAR